MHRASTFYRPSTGFLPTGPEELIGDGLSRLFLHRRQGVRVGVEVIAMLEVTFPEVSVVLEPARALYPYAARIAEEKRAEQVKAARRKLAEDRRRDQERRERDRAIRVANEATESQNEPPMTAAERWRARVERRRKQRRGY